MKTARNTDQPTRVRKTLYRPPYVESDTGSLTDAEERAGVQQSSNISPASVPLRKKPVSRILTRPTPIATTSPTAESADFNGAMASSPGRTLSSSEPGVFHDVTSFMAGNVQPLEDRRYSRILRQGFEPGCIIHVRDKIHPGSRIDGRILLVYKTLTNMLLCVTLCRYPYPWPRHWDHLTHSWIHRSRYRRPQSELGGLMSLECILGTGSDGQELTVHPDIAINFQDIWRVDVDAHAAYLGHLEPNSWCVARERIIDIFSAPSSIATPSSTPVLAQATPSSPPTRNIAPPMQRRSSVSFADSEHPSRSAPRTVRLADGDETSANVETITRSILKNGTYQSSPMQKSRSDQGMRSERRLSGHAESSGPRGPQDYYDGHSRRSSYTRRQERPGPSSREMGAIRSSGGKRMISGVFMNEMEKEIIKRLFKEAGHDCTYLERWDRGFERYYANS